MTAQLAPTSIFKGWDNNGSPLAFGLLTTYIAGTTTPLATYVDSTQTTQNTNPIQLNFRGECSLWLDPTKSYKFLLQDSQGNTIPGWPVDNINGPLSPQSSIIPNVSNAYTLGNTSFSWANAYFGPNNIPVFDIATGNIGYYKQTAAEIAASVTPTDYAYAPEPIMDSRREGGINDPSVQNAINASTGTNETIAVVGTTPGYDSGVLWNGRPHMTTGLPFRINNITWAGVNLTARACVVDKYLYLCEYVNNRIGILSLDDPRNPVYLRNFPVGTTPRHIEVVGRYVFVANFGSNTITVYDLSNPSSASLVGTITTGAGPKQFVIVGNDIFCVCYNANTIEQYRFYLPTSGLTGFLFTTIAITNVPNGPICVAYNGSGILGIVGIDTAGVALVGTATLNLISNTTIGGSSARHPGCIWASKSQLLVTDNINGQLVSLDCESLTPVVSATANTTSATPEQIELVGSRCYVANLTTPGTAGSIDCFDLTNVRAPVRYKNVPCIGNGTGFTAFYGDDRSAFLYVTCHYSPYGLDVLELPVADFPNRAPNYLQEVSAAQNGRYAVLNVQQNITTVVTITYSATMVPDGSQGNAFIITATNGTAFSISNPINCAIGQRLEFTIRNTSGGALGAVTWAGNYKLSTWTQPANANSRSIRYRYDGTNWIEVSRTPADVPN